MGVWISGGEKGGELTYWSDPLGPSTEEVKISSETICPTRDLPCAFFWGGSGEGGGRLAILIQLKKGRFDFTWKMEATSFVTESMLDSASLLISPGSQLSIGQIVSLRKGSLNSTVIITSYFPLNSQLLL